MTGTTPALPEAGVKRGLVVWRITDGRAGHDTQSRGLLQALASLRDCNCFDIRAQPFNETLLQLMTRRFAAGAALPDPDFIVGAGHGTHMTLLAARRARGGLTVVLMKPSLPTGLFDYCLIPAHDQPPPRPNILLTRGVLNCATPSRQQSPGQGLILIGGPSRHHGWDAPGLLHQVREICNAGPDRHWSISDSPRTPPATRTAIMGASITGAQFTPHGSTTPDWLARQLSRASTVWVSEDSISMVCEALSAGAAVGVLSVPVKRRGRVTRALEDLTEAGLITRFSDWRTGAAMRPPQPPLQEATRCARILLEQALP